MSFADRLHMKVYWASGGDAVIGWANLTSNALGAGNLKELAVLVPARTAPIKRLLQQIGPKTVSEADLARLEREHRQFYERQHGTIRRGSPASGSPRGADHGVRMSAPHRCRRGRARG